MATEEHPYPKYKGVRRRRWGAWVSEIRVPKKKERLWLGSFPSPHLAALAHDIAELGFKGPAAASLNFPESARLSIPRHLTAEAIRAAAFDAAVGLDLPQEHIVHLNSCLDNGVGGDYEGEGEGDGDGEGELESPPSHYVDDELLFQLPSIICNMAYALLLPPPSFDSSHLQEDDFRSPELFLWNY